MSVVVKFFTQKQGLQKVLNSEHLLPQLAALALVVNNILLPPVLFSRYPLYLEAVHSSIQYKSTEPLLNRAGAQKLAAAARAQDSTYGLWG